MELTRDLLFKIFEYGVDFGQLIMEEEREGEGLFDAFCCKLASDKYNTPSSQAKTRQVHSEKWFNAKRQSQIKLFEIVNKIK